MRRTIIALLVLGLFATPARAEEYAVNDLIVGLHLNDVVKLGDGQSYNFLLAPHRVEQVEHVYLIVALNEHTNIFAVNHTGNIDCSRHDGTGTIVFCSTETLTTTALIGIHGTVKGPGEDGVYGAFRVGTIANGSPGSGWLLEATYLEPGETIPTNLQPTDEPGRNTIYIPEVRN